MRPMLSLIALVCLSGLLASCHPQVAPICYVDTERRGHRLTTEASVMDSEVAVGEYSEERCAEIDGFIAGMRTIPIRSGRCPDGVSAVLRTVEVTNASLRSLRVSYGGHRLTELIPSSDPTADPYEFRGLLPFSTEDWIQFRGRRAHAESRITIHPARADYCIYPTEEGRLLLEPVELVGRSGTYAAIAYNGMALAYQYEIPIDDEPMSIAVDYVSSETIFTGPTDRVETLVATIEDLHAEIRSLSASLGETELELAGVTSDLSESMAETERERELRIRAEETIRQQMEIIRHLRHGLRVSRRETEGLRDRLASAEARMRTMVPQSVVDAIVEQRLGEAEYAWAMRTLSRSVARGSSMSGFCETLLGAGVSALPGLFLSLVGGPAGFLAGLAMDILAGFAGEALAFVASPVISAICN